MFSESRLWECRVFPVSADNCVWCFNAILQGLLKTVYGNVVFSRSKMHARHKSLVFFRSLAICSCSLRLCKALWGFWRYWKSLGWFGTGFSEYEVTFACIFTGFAESRPWECRVFSFKIARTSQKSRVFPFTFAPSCRQSHVLCVFFICFCTSVCDSVLLRCSLWQAVPESSWYFNII